jgi:two-component system cell cycle sensor histidine kinase/response regulator CckA
MLVLLVEDDPAHQAAIQRAFEASGSEFEVQVVGTLREFRQSSVERTPNIAVMDLNLPDGRATEVLTCPPEAGQFPILVMTSFGNEQVAVEAIKAGALEYVVKSPEAFADMPHTITHALHEWKLLQERKQAEAALEFKNIILSTQQEASIDGILVADENGEIISFNRRFVDIWDIPSDIADSKSDEQILQSVMNKLVDPGEFVGKLEQLHEDRQEISQDEIALKDGRTFDRYSAPMLGEGGKYYGRVWYFRDITDRKRAEQALQMSQYSIDQASHAVFWMNRDGGFSYVNDQARFSLGYTREELLRLHLWDIDSVFPKELWFSHWAGYQSNRRGGTEHLESVHRRKDGSTFPVEVVSKHLWFGEEELHVAFVHDITERKKAEKALREKEEWFRTVFENASDGMFFLSTSGEIVLVNKSFAAMHGYSVAEILKMNVKELDTPESNRLFPERMRRVLAGENLTFEVDQYHKQGHLFPLEVTANMVAVGGKKYILASHRDITGRKQAEEALQASQERLRQIFEASPNVTSVFRMEGQNLRRTWVSPNLERLLGYTVEEALQPHWWSAHVQPEDLARVIIESSRIPAHEHVVHEYRFLRRDGSVVWIHDELRLLRDATGQPREVVGAWTDITERKELETHLLRTQRLESVGRLASGIAHDLNNILAPMLMAPSLLREAIQDPELRNMLDLIETNAQRGSNIIKQLLTFGRGLEGERVPVQLRTLVTDMSGIIRETFHKNITTWREMPPDTWLVSGDETQLHQVLMNLCVNARDAMPEGGTLTLKLENHELDESFARMTPGARPGRYVCLSVTDTGEGIAPEHLDKIYDPFFTTKELGKGTGLGLSTVLGIVQSHGGFIQVHSQPGRGTQFKAYLPASETAEARPASQANQPLPQGGGELVLVVDDESSVRQVTRQLLERNGYRVIEAVEGADGITQYVAHQQEVQVVVTDLSMPVMDGPTFIRVLRRLNPQVRVIAVSGDQVKSSLPADLGVPDEAHLSKPFSGAMLLQALQRALHPEAPPRD